jgi:hypothetical protein
VRSFTAEKYAAKEGVDYRALGFMEALEYRRKFASEYGRSSEVLLFEVFVRQPTGVSAAGFRERVGRIVETLRAPAGRAINSEVLARRFCLAVLELDAS